MFHGVVTFVFYERLSIFCEIFRESCYNFELLATKLAMANNINELNAHERDQRVSFDADTHTYTIDGSSDRE